ncbi:MAG: response regulator transcription factor [Pseudomonadota bacterium]|nr:response regulator transcription factor [Pseudomonadota bacterium]
MKPRILLVEDTFALRVAVSASLRAAGYDVTAVGSAEEAREEAERASPALVVLDWMLPGEQGIDLLRGWRAAGLRVPVILLTARDAVPDRVAGLGAGANDYVVKPFATEELLARVAVQLRDRAALGARLRLSDRDVDLAREVVHLGAEEISLTTQEARCLAYLAERAGRNVDREDLLRDVWGYRGGVVTRSVDNTVLRLRAKIEPDPARPRHVLTVQGVGYRFEP